MNAFTRLLRLLIPYKWSLTIGTIALIAATSTTLAIPLFIKQLMDVVTIEKDLKALDKTATIIGCLFLFQIVSSAINGYVFELLQKRVVTDLRESVFKHLQTLSVSFFVKRRTGEIVSRMTNDVATIESVVVELPVSILQNSIRLLGGVAIIIYISWKLTFMIVALAPFLVLLAQIFGKKLKQLSTEILDNLADSTIILEENISCVQVVKSFVRGHFEYDRFKEAVEKSFQAAKRRVIISAVFFGPSVVFILFSAALILLWYGGRGVITGTISPGELIAFILYAVIISGPLGAFAKIYTRLQEALGASRRIFEILDSVAEIQDKPDAQPIPTISGKVEIRDLRFHYHPDQEVLRGISFSVEPGQKIALVGPSGAGKSTLVQLLHRFYDPCAGEIRVDGIPIRDIKLSTYWEQIGLVPQETLLFGGTVEENIKYGKKGVTQEEIIDAAKAAHAHDFIVDCPDGYQTVVGEKGVRLSVGQRQRIAIARVILKNPCILLLDEATSSLDNESEMYIQKALEQLMKGRTSFVIAHRLSTIHNADKIIVLESGKIVEMGNHEELMQKKGLYHYLYTLKSLQMGQIRQEKETKPSYF